MADSFTTTTHQSWGSRLVGSITGVLVGLVMIVGAVVVLFWNEANTLDTSKSLQEGAAVVVDIAPDAVDPANEAKLVHVTGPAAAAGQVSDTIFQVSAPALRLQRDVEMYQWTESESSEEKKNLGGSTDTVTTYKYEPKWSSSLVDSAKFKQPDGHANPATMVAEAETFVAPEITLGAFLLPASVVEKMSGDEKIVPTKENFAALPEGLKKTGRLTATGYYFGQDPATVAVGDQRVTFTVLKPGTFSIVAQQNGRTFQPYPAKAGKEVELVESGTQGSALMFKHAQDENRVFAWILRFVGFLVMLIGCALVLKPLGVLADVVPFLGNLVGAGTFLASLLLAAFGTLVTIAFAWLAVRPLLGGTLLLVSIGLLAWAFVLGAKRRRLKAS